MIRHACQSVCITGGTGFLGQHVVDKLLSTTESSLHLLSRNSHNRLFEHRSRVSFYRGNLLDTESLQNFLQPNSLVINLAYLNEATHEENLQAVRNLLLAAREKSCPRFLHCSTAVVVGRSSENSIDEKTPCHPSTTYEKTKYEIEKLILNENSANMETVSIRPTAIFGPGGKNLVKLADDLTDETKTIQFLKNSLYGKRTLNAVCVENVTAAIAFLAQTEEEISGESYLVSDDDVPENNFHDVIQKLGQLLNLHRGHSFRVPIPKLLLRSILAITGRSNTNPNRTYNSKKIELLGYRKTVTFSEGLESFCDWYSERKMS